MSVFPFEKYFNYIKTEVYKPHDSGFVYIFYTLQNLFLLKLKFFHLKPNSSSAVNRVKNEKKQKQTALQIFSTFL